jgi:hypothetical protein
MAGATIPSGPHCSWCSAATPAAATRCPACGAALVQHEAIAEVRIPGLTVVDPALEAWNAQPLRIAGPSPSQGMAGSAIVAAAGGGPAGLVALGALAGAAAVEYLGAGPEASSRPIDPEHVGELDGYVVQALEHYERGDPRR